MTGTGLTMTGAQGAGRRLAATLGGLVVALLLAPASHASVESLDDWTTGLTHSVSAGNERLLLFVVGAEHATPPIGSITGVTWGDQALTPIGSAAVASGFENRLEIWLRIRRTGGSGSLREVLFAAPATQERQEIAA